MITLGSPIPTVPVLCVTAIFLISHLCSAVLQISCIYTLFRPTVRQR